MAKKRNTSKNISKNISKNLIIDSKNLSETDIEKQEHLSAERLAVLKPSKSWAAVKDFCKERPTQNLIDLMHWVETEFAAQEFPSDWTTLEKNIQCFIHNKIVMDGSFMEFCEQTKTTISTLYLDSIASWRSEHNFEHFMAQGIFKISRDGMEFLHAALFHKGNQNEDEVSFFIVAPKRCYDKYIAFRNEFDKWLISRDREHLEVHVVGGEGIPYSRDMSWDDLFLPKDLKNDIRESVEGWLSAKEIYTKSKVPWKRGILLYGLAGNGKTSTIRTIISNYDFKPVTVYTSHQTNDETITEAFEYAQQQEPGLLYIEDLDTLLSGTVSLSHFLNLMDGVSTKNGIMVIATANDISKLRESVTDRPSRFDRKWEIPLPDKEMALKYLYKWFGDKLKAENEVLAQHCVDNQFSYAYLKELYLTSIFNALANNREIPDLDDIKKAVKQLLRDKKLVRDNFEVSASVRRRIGIS